jgi:hypothetical protein
MMKDSVKRSFQVAAVAVAMLFAAVHSMAQPATGAAQKVDAASFAGRYEGTLKDESGDATLTLNIVADAGKVSGTLTTPRGVFKIVKGELSSDSLFLEIERPGGNTGTITVHHAGTGLTASFTDGGKKLTVELQKIVADDISGEWDAVADAQGQAFPFTLTLKLDGEKVTGSSISQLGTANISKGTWKDGRLSLVLDSQTGEITLVAGMDGEKLSGDYDYGGQMQGKWIATRKK